MLIIFLVRSHGCKLKTCCGDFGPVMLAGSLFPNDPDFPTINECRGVLAIEGSNPLPAVHRARGRVILLLHGVHDAAGPLAVSVRCLKLDPAIPRAVRPSIKVPS